MHASQTPVAQVPRHMVTSSALGQGLWVKHTVPWGKGGWGLGSWQKKSKPKEGVVVRREALRQKVSGQEWSHTGATRLASVT